MQVLFLLPVILLVGGCSSDAVADCSSEIRLVSSRIYKTPQFIGERTRAHGRYKSASAVT